ncbi:MAG: dephospho-CoA kinase [Candidatus Omnitrophota bacterium]
MKKQGFQPKKIVIAVTGGFGTGKSTVAQIFESLGAKVIDADKITRNLLKTGTSTYKKILEVFGKKVLKESGAIDRSKLALIVFGNKKLLLKLNKIVHPEVIKIIKQKIEGLNKGVVVLDIPLLFEAGLECLADKIVVVSSSRQNQYGRLLRKTSLSKNEIAKRINAQMPLSKKIRRADFIIDNDYSIKNTKKQVQKLRRILWRS